MLRRLLLLGSSFRYSTCIIRDRGRRGREKERTHMMDGWMNNRNGSMEMTRGGGQREESTNM
jgi:hypothetical protein